MGLNETVQTRLVRQKLNASASCSCHADNPMVTQTLLALSYSMLDVPCMMCNRCMGRMVTLLLWLRRPPLMLASLDLRVISFPAQPTWRSVLCCAVLY